MQQTLRVRDAAAYSIYVTRFENSLPVAPTEQVGFAEAMVKEKLTPEEEIPTSLIHHISYREALSELNGKGPVEYLTYHLNQVGVEVEVLPCPSASPGTLGVLKNRQIQLLFFVLGLFRGR